MVLMMWMISNHASRLQSLESPWVSYYVSFIFSSNSKTLDFKHKGVPICADIVYQIPIESHWLQETVRIFPGYDETKMRFLKKRKLFSHCNDGVIVKECRWRLSFSRSEAKILESLDERNIVYKAIKFLGSISGLSINSYFLKVNLKFL